MVKHMQQAIMIPTIISVFTATAQVNISQLVTVRFSQRSINKYLLEIA